LRAFNGKTDRKGTVKTDSIETGHGTLRYPCFLPDATRGVVRCVGPDDLRSVGISGVMVNAIHLARRPGTALISRLGGIHDFMGWSGPVVSDSGGFQIYSLISRQSRLGSVSDRGFAYRFSADEKRRLVTPEKCIRHQFRLGADMMFCLDVCTHPDEDESRQLQSCKRTVAWAKRCKNEFDARVGEVPDDQVRPLLFAVVQGGSSPDLRRICAEQLQEIGFDGYGFGGWPIGSDGELVDAVHQLAFLLPPDVPKFALGIGRPDNLVRAYHAGYDLFDCAMPTRDARHKRLLVFCGKPEDLSFDDSAFYNCIYLEDAKHTADRGPVDETCDCLCCTSFSRAYLHHLFKIGDSLALRLASIHNLRFYVRLTEALAKRNTND